MGRTKNRDYGKEQRKNCDIVLKFEFLLWVCFNHIYVHFIFNHLNKDEQSEQVQFAVEDFEACKTLLGD